MKVIDWIDYEDQNYEEISNEEWPLAREAVIEEVRKNNYHFTGNYHQYGEYGCPLLDNNKKVCTSQRIWGGIIADAFPEEFDDPNDQYNYVMWYLGPFKEVDGKCVFDEERCHYPKDSNGDINRFKEN